MTVFFWEIGGFTPDSTVPLKSRHDEQDLGKDRSIPGTQFVVPARGGKYFQSIKYELVVQSTGTHPFESRLMEAYISEMEELS